MKKTIIILIAIWYFFLREKKTIVSPSETGTGSQTNKPDTPDTKPPIYSTTPETIYQEPVIKNDVQPNPQSPVETIFDKPIQELKPVIIPEVGQVKPIESIFENQPPIINTPTIDIKPVKDDLHEVTTIFDQKPISDVIEPAKPNEKPTQDVVSPIISLPSDEEPVIITQPQKPIQKPIIEQPRLIKLGDAKIDKSILIPVFFQAFRETIGSFTLHISLDPTKFEFIGVRNFKAPNSSNLTSYFNKQQKNLALVYWSEKDFSWIDNTTPLFEIELQPLVQEETKLKFNNPSWSKNQVTTGYTELQNVIFEGGSITFNTK